MRYVKLEVFEDEKIGELALRVHNSASSLDGALEGSLIAHDILEHQNGIRAIGSVGDELEALGGLWFVRGVMWDINRFTPSNYYTPHENVASDVTRLLEFVVGGTPLRVTVPNTYTHCCDYDFEEIISIAKEESDHGPQEQYFSDVLNLLRAGYNKANKRFKGNKAFAGNQFWAIAKAVDTVVNRIEFAGQEFQLSYGNGKAFCEPVGAY